MTLVDVGMLLSYVVGGMVTFRVTYLRSLEKAEREMDACANSSHRWPRDRKECDSRSSHYDGISLVPAAMSAFWPLVVTGLLAWRAMFPRGTVTKYSRQLELERKQAVRQKELDKLADDIRKASQAAGLRVPEGL